ncbi:MAG TPA: hypothetical protein VFR93_10805, partial [Candidatus Limnocylindrales bacterium]|nr:hypothetical protein [Candidatus Limnocylindrales bacterium]
LGVQTWRLGGWLTLGHSGRVLGFRSQLRFVPAAGVTIAVLSNQSAADLAPLVRTVLGIVLQPATGPSLTPAARRG